MLPLLALALGAAGAATGLAYLACYGGFEGPVDWAMNTAVHGSREARRIALTFDDGPDPVRTPALLDALGELGVHATFFLVGNRVDRFPELAARIAREGHELGNHTYSHRYLPLARSRSVAAELAATDTAIERATGCTPLVARPPYGGRSPFNVRAFRRADKKLVLWDVNSFDWKGLPAGEIARGVVDRTRPGSIILMHDGRRSSAAPRPGTSQLAGDELTIDAVRLVVPALRDRGFELSTVTGLLAA